MKETLCCFVLLVTLGAVRAQPVAVLTHRYNNTRTGWNARESKLTTDNLNLNSFGIVATLTVDDQVYAQPLLLPALTINGTTRTVLIAGTVNNTVYAFDGDQFGAPLWQTNLTPPGARPPRNTDMTGACNSNYKDFSGSMGIVGTPVIDSSTATLYVVSRHVVGTRHEQLLHALDLTTGGEKPGSPVVITATYPGKGDGNVNGVISFDPKKNNQRSALLLHRGIVYVCWASHCDWAPYHGWIMGFDAKTLVRTITYNTTPNGENGGIWMSGAGPTVDADGFMYVTVGNGSFSSSANGDRSECVLKLKPTGSTLTEVDYFVPKNYAALEKDDLDYGVDGLLLIPNTMLSLSGSKEGKLYLLDTQNLGHFTTTNAGVKQEIYVNTQNVYDKHIHGTPVYYRSGNGSNPTETVFVWSESDYLTQLRFDRSVGTFDLVNPIKGNIKLDYGMPGSTLTVSSNGDTPGTGIVWASHPLSGDANQQLRPGSLDAYDARDVRKRLWSSSQYPRDELGFFAKFNNPVVANGKVYMATFASKIVVYGLLPLVTATEPLPSESFLIYPNPTQRNFSVQYTLTGSRSAVSLRVADLLGRTVLTQPVNAGVGTHTQLISGSDRWSAGVYQVLLEVDGQVLKQGKLIRN